MRRKLCILAATSLAALSLASCSSTADSVSISVNTLAKNYTVTDVTPASPTYDALANKDLDIYINYEGTSGITFRGTSWYNTIDGKIYTQGALLPTWAKLGEITGTNVREACGYKATTNDGAYTAVATAGYKSETDPANSIDLFYNSISNLKTAGNSGALVDLLPYLEAGKMPNLKAYLESEGAGILEQAKVNGHLYYTPYVDGTNDVSRAFILNADMVKKVLTESGDTDTTNGGTNPSANGLKKGAYTSFLGGDTYTVKASNGATTTDVAVAAYSKTVNGTTCTDIISAQNALLENGCSGKELADQLVDYLTTRYPSYASNLADIYVSEQAVYTVDELVALMRVVKANPKLLNGGKEIEVFFPRGESSTAIENVYDLAQLWGVQGVDSTNGNYYYAADGTLNSLETTKASYDVLKYISQLYDEGLILENFYVGTAQSSGNSYLNEYFEESTSGFMMYDDISIVSQANKEVEGIGSSKSTSTSYTPVIAPYTLWSTEGNTAKQDLADSTNKTLTRYYESSRSLQTTSWAIPKTSDNVDAAIRMMDVMYSEYGRLVQNYGPEEYWEVSGTNKISTDLFAGEKNAIVSLNTKLELADSNTDYWSFMRGYLGAGHGVGYARLNGANIQAVNVYSQSGLLAIQSAIANGSLQHAKSSDTRSWNVNVPTMFSTNVVDDNNAWDGITGFWAANKINKNEGWVNVVVSDYTTTTDNYVIKTAKNSLPITWENMQKQMSVRDKNCLYVYANSIAADAVPTYPEN